MYSDNFWRQKLIWSVFSQVKNEWKFTKSAFTSQIENIIFFKVYNIKSVKNENKRFLDQVNLLSVENKASYFGIEQIICARKLRKNSNFHQSIYDKVLWMLLLNILCILTLHKTKYWNKPKKSQQDWIFELFNPWITFWNWTLNLWIKNPTRTPNYFVEMSSF